ncbi:MAG TPA: ABC transporter permease [Puia sp.]|jgi:putative ABC transport system permease protein|nr:ABC transporter permease [Puia sp.]
MFRNYCTIIFRNLWKNKLYTIVNIVTLAVGIASIVWGFQTYRYSFSFNNFHKDQKSIFRVLTKVQGNDNLKGYCPEYLAIIAKNDFPVINETVRWDSRGLNVKAEGNDPFEAQAHFTDPAFFDFFNFPLIRGTNELADRSTVLITQSAAKKYFGDTDPLGKTLTFYSDEFFKMPLKVTGILKDPPINSSFQFELITNNDNQLKADGSHIKNDDWEWFSDAVFVRLSNPADAPRLARDFAKYVPLQQSARQDIQLKSFTLDPLSNVLNELTLENNGLYRRPEDSATFGPLVLAILILLSACLNFANTSVAQSNRRLKEMGVRKVMGSSLRQIILQQLMECAVIVLMAIFLSVAINNFWLPTFSSMFNGLKVEAHYLSDYTLFAFLGVIFIAVTLLAGAYPAFYISRFNATNIFRGAIKFGGSNLFSRVLLGLQVAISFITVIAGVAFSRNSAFQSKYDYGYQKENVIGVDLQGESAYIPARDAFNNIQGIDKLAGTVNNIGFSYSRLPLQAKGIKNESIYIKTGDNYIDLMRLKLIAGRNFIANSKSDIGKSMIINEKLAFQFGWKPDEAIGKQIKPNDTTTCTVIGVLKDFTQETLFDPLQPVAMVLADPSKYSKIIIRAKPGSLSSVFAETKSAWLKLYPTKPFRGYYQDELDAQAANVNESVATIFRWFALISVLMAATSMFALVSLNVLKKSKEIAIRKVVGAEDKHIFQLVMKGYIWILLLSAVIGCYGGYALSKLLMDLIFRINSGVSSSSLAISFIGVLLICGATIGARVWLVLRTKATDALKAN